MMRKYEAERPNDVRSDAPEDLALRQGFADKAKLVVFEITQTTVDQLGGRRRRADGQVVALDQQDLQASASRVPRDAAAVDAATDDREVVHGLRGAGRRTTAKPTDSRRVIHEARASRTFFSVLSAPGGRSRGPVPSRVSP